MGIKKNNALKALGATGPIVDVATGGASGGAFSALTGFLSTILGGSSGADLLYHPATSTPEHIEQPSQLLRAEHQVVPFLEEGRRELLDDLNSWCQSAHPASVRLYTGAGGMGKTRLLIHTLNPLLERGWRAGFLSSKNGEIIASKLDDLASARGNTFIVIDYAENRIPALNALLKLIALTKRAGKIRIVLIARDAGSWWTDLYEQDADIEHNIQFHNNPIPVKAMTGGALTREQFFTHSASAFARALGKQINNVPAPSLNAPAFDGALVIQMAALLWVQGETIHGDGDVLTNILNQTLAHERRYVTKMAKAKHLDETLMPALSQALTFVTLAGGVQSKNPEQARTLVSRVPLLDDQSKATVNQITNILSHLYPGKGSLNPLQPDILGEHLVEREAEADPSLLDAFFSSAEGAQTVHGLIILVRLMARKPNAIEFINNVLQSHGEILFLNLENSNNLNLLRVLQNHLPHNTTTLLEMATLVTQKLLDGIKNIPGEIDADRLSFIAVISNNLSHRLSDIGQLKEALEASTESVNIYRDLAGKEPDAHLPNLATSLGSQAAKLGALGQLEGALEASTESVAICRDLVGQNPNIFLANLATSLSNHTVRLGQFVRYDEALEASTETVAIYRDLVAATPTNTLLYRLAASLHNLANVLSYLDRHEEEALEAITESVNIYRDIAGKEPDAHLPNLATSLSNQAARLDKLGRPEEALEIIIESVNIQRDLADQNPNAFLPKLAIYLGRYSQILERAQRLREALGASKEALTIITPLFLNLPQAFEGWATTLSDQYITLCQNTETEPDKELLMPVLDLLDHIKNNHEDNGGGDQE